MIWNALVITSTVPIGGHYAIALPCGAIVWLVATGAAVASMSMHETSGSSRSLRDPSHGRLSYRMGQTVTSIQTSN
jgi:hypothetical protein